MGTLIWTDTFDSYTGTVGSPWTTSGAGGGAISTTKFVSSPNSVKIGAGGVASNCARALGSNVAAGYFDFRLCVNSAFVGAPTSSIVFYDGTASAAQLTLTFTSDGYGTLYLGASGSATVLGHVALSPDSFHEITMYASIGSSELAQIAVDGNLQMTFSGNTQSTAHTYYNAVMLSSNTIGAAPDAFAYVDNLSVYSGTPGPLAGSSAVDPVWTDNFDTYTSTPNPPWFGTAMSLSTAIYYSSPNSLKVGPGGYGYGSQRAIAPVATGYVSVEYDQIATSSGTTYLVLWDREASAAQITVAFGTGGTATVYRGSSGGTSLGTFSFSPATFHLLKITATIASSGGSIAITVAGSSVFTYSGNTQSTANARFTDILFTANTIGPSPPAQAFADDVIVGATIPTLSNTLWVGYAPPANQSFMGQII